MDAQQLAVAAAHLADQKKGEEIRIYDVSDHIKVADYFVLISGLSRPHVRAIYDQLHVLLKAAGRTHSRAEGSDLGWWVLLDFGDVVVHVLQPEARDYYGLDALYQECPQLDWRAIDPPAEIDVPASRPE